MNGIRDSGEPASPLVDGGCTVYLAGVAECGSGRTARGDGCHGYLLDGAAGCEPVSPGSSTPRCNFRGELGRRAEACGGTGGNGRSSGGGGEDAKADGLTAQLEAACELLRRLNCLAATHLREAAGQRTSGGGGGGRGPGGAEQGTAGLSCRVAPKAPVAAAPPAGADGCGSVVVGEPRNAAADGTASAPAANFQAGAKSQRTSAAGGDRDRRRSSDGRRPGSGAGWPGAGEAGGEASEACARSDSEDREADGAGAGGLHWGADWGSCSGEPPGSGDGGGSGGISGRDHHYRRGGGGNGGVDSGGDWSRHGESELLELLRQERERANELAAQVQELQRQVHEAAEVHADEVHALQSLLADEMSLRQQQEEEEELQRKHLAHRPQTILHPHGLLHPASVPNLSHLQPPPGYSFPAPAAATAQAASPSPFQFLPGGSLGLQQGAAPFASPVPPPPATTPAAAATAAAPVGSQTAAAAAATAAACRSVSHAGVFGAFEGRSAAEAATAVLSPSLSLLLTGQGPPSTPLGPTPLAAAAAASPFAARPAEARTPYFSPVGSWLPSLTPPRTPYGSQWDGLNTDTLGLGVLPGAGEMAGLQVGLEQLRQKERQWAAEMQRLRQAHAEEVAALESRHRKEVQKLRSAAAAAQQQAQELQASVQKLQGDVRDYDQLIDWLTPEPEDERPVGPCGSGRNHHHHHHNHHHQLHQHQQHLYGKPRAC